MAPPSLELAAIGLARWLENSRALCGTVPVVPTGGFVLCILLVLRGVFAMIEAAGVTEVFFLDSKGHPWSLGQDLSFFTGILDVVMAAIGMAGLGGKNAQLVKYLAVWTLIRVGLALVLAVLYFFEQAPGHGAVLVQRLVVGAGLFAVDLELLWIGVRLVLAATLSWTLSPEMLHFICKAQGVALARRDAHVSKHHLVAVLLTDYEASRMLEVAHADLGLMRAEVTLPCDTLADMQSRGFLDAVPLGHDLEATLHAALHLQTQGGEDLLRVDHFLAALCSTDNIRLHIGGGGGPLRLDSSVRLYPVDGQAIATQAATIRAHLQAVKGLRDAPSAAEASPTLLGRLPLEETVLVYSILRALVALVGLLVILFGNGNLLQLLAHRKVTPIEARGMECLQCFLSLGFNFVGIRAMMRHRDTRRAVQAAAAAEGGLSGDELHKAFDSVRGHPQADAWLHTFRVAAGALGLLLAWGPAELLMDIPIMGLAVVRADVCRMYSAGIVRVGSARILPLAAQVQLHCTWADLGTLASVGGCLLLKMYMCWAVLALWHQYAFGWTTTDLRGAAYLALNPFQPAFGFGERQKLLP